MIKTNLSAAFAPTHIDESKQTSSYALSTAVPTRRALMNMMVSTALVGASAVPIASPSVAAASRSGVPAGGLERLQSAINLLRSSYVCDGWKVDEAGAEQALQYFRNGCPDDDDAWSATIEFFNSHGLSYDWIICGDVGSLVCLAAMPNADPPIGWNEPVSHANASAEPSAGIATRASLCRCRAQALARSRY